MDTDEPTAPGACYEMRTPTWSSGPIRVASTRRHRRFGLRRTIGTAVGLALKARSVHTFGMARRISVVACDRSGRVLRAQRLRPRRLFYTARAALIIETFAPELPKVGDIVEVSLRKNGQPATGNGQSATGNGQPATGNRQRVSGNR
ncbi:MAG: hypothetical protein WEA29_04570 [Acidimicrobiia bacterium]